MPTPLPCITNLIQFEGNPTQWVNINVVTGKADLIGLLNPPDAYVNAIGYNPLDNFIYGYDITINEIVQVDADRNVISLGRPSGLPINGYNSGCIDNNGFFYLLLNNAARFYTVDLRPSSPTYMRLVNPLNGYTAQTTNYGTATINGTMNVSDWVADNNGFLYGVAPNGVMQRLNLANAHVINMTTTGPRPNASFGAVGMDKNNNIYAVENNDGGVYRYTIDDIVATAELFSYTYFASFNDGCMCQNAEILLDFGDAPDLGPGNGSGNYNTLLDNNGPRHQLINELFLGTQATAENDAHENGDATGDDLNAGIQDDGVTTPLPVLIIGATNYDLEVTVTNNSGLSANLYGWIDFNQNGLFEPNEAAQVLDIPSTPGTQMVTLSFTLPQGVTPTQGNTFVRLRLTTDELVAGADAIGQDSASVGSASDGEVEDYILAIAPVADLEITIIADKNEVVPGDIITYTITVTNNGPSSAQTPLLVDNMPPMLRFASYSLDGGMTWNDWSGSFSLPTMDADNSQVVLLKGMVNLMAASSSFSNMASVSSATYDPDLTNNTDTATNDVIDSADISILKIADSAQAIAGDSIYYTLLISNAGPSSAENVLLTDDMPASIINAKFSLDDGDTWNAWVSPYNIGTLTSGAVMRILMRGDVPPDVRGNITNVASLESDTPDPDESNNISTSVTPAVTSADLVVTKSGSPNPVEAGEVLTHTVTVGNLGPSNAQNVVISDNPPSVMTNVMFSIDGGVTWSNWNGTLTVPMLMAGDNVELWLRSTIDSSATGVLSNEVTVTSDTPDPDMSNNEDNETTAVDNAADLSIRKAATPDVVDLSQVLVYTIIVENDGPDDAENIVVTDIAPAELINMEFSDDSGATWQPWLGTYMLAALDADDDFILLIQGTVNSLGDGIITNTANVSSDTPDHVPQNNSITIYTPVETAADLVLTKTATSATINAGEELTYAIAIENLGPNDAENVVLVDDISELVLQPEVSLNNGATWESWESPCTLGTISNGTTAMVLIRGLVNAAADPAVTPTIRNTASVRSDTPDPNMKNNSDNVITPITLSADISVTKTGDPDPVEAGQMLAYTFNVTNTGPSNARRVVLADAVPSSILAPEFSLDNGSTWVLWNDTCSIANPSGVLAADETITVLIRGMVSAAITGNVINTATVLSPTPDPNLTNNQFTEITYTQASADMAVVKTATSSSVQAGAQLNYTITVQNKGPSYARDVEIEDTMPVELNNAEFSLDAGNSWQPWMGNYMIGDVAAGATIVVLARGTINQHTTDTISNTVNVASTTPDSDLTNNTSTANSIVEESANLSIKKHANAAVAIAGEQLSYTLTIANAGPSDAEQVVLTDSVHLVTPEFSVDGGLTWNAWISPYTIGTLVSGDEYTVLIRGIVMPGAGDVIHNTASVSSNTPDPEQSDNIARVRMPVAHLADLSIHKESDRTSVMAGDVLIYTLTVSNAGPSDAHGVVITDELPTALTNVQYSDDDGATWHAWNDSYNVASLAASDTFALLLHSTISTAVVGGVLTNMATVSSVTPDPDLSNNKATQLTPVNSAADLSITKSASKKDAQLGDEIIYTITLQNHGPDHAQNVSLFDDVPTGLIDVSFSDDDGITWQPWIGRHSVGLLAPDENRVYLIRGTIDEFGTIGNTAFVSSPTPDLVLDNNYSTANIVVPCSSCPKPKSPCPGPSPKPPCSCSCPAEALADICIEQKASVHTASPCDELTYTINVANKGPHKAMQVFLEDDLPSELCNARYSIDGKSWHKWKNVLCLGDMDCGVSATVLIRCRVHEDAWFSFTNIARVDARTKDPNISNNRCKVITRIKKTFH
ncbi:MAG: DUF11 domain-containing protein [Oscillospiraceae bacterium]|nr:DUF11 domain-containing protein [Oscillospiraceae bacterium]